MRHQAWKMWGLGWMIWGLVACSGTEFPNPGGTNDGDSHVKANDPSEIGKLSGGTTTIDSSTSPTTEASGTIAPSTTLPVWIWADTKNTTIAGSDSGAQNITQPSAPSGNSLQHWPIYAYGFSDCVQVIRPEFNRLAATTIPQSFTRLVNRLVSTPSFQVRQNVQERLGFQLRIQENQQEVLAVTFTEEQQFNGVQWLGSPQWQALPSRQCKKVLEVQETLTWGNQVIQVLHQQWQYQPGEWSAEALVTVDLYLDLKASGPSQTRQFRLVLPSERLPAEQREAGSRTEYLFELAP